MKNKYFVTGRTVYQVSGPCTQGSSLCWCSFFVLVGGFIGRPSRRRGGVGISPFLSEQVAMYVGWYIGERSSRDLPIFHLFSSPNSINSTPGVHAAFLKLHHLALLLFPRTFISVLLPLSSASPLASAVFFFAPSSISSFLLLRCSICPCRVLVPRERLCELGLRRFQLTDPPGLSGLSPTAGRPLTPPPPPLQVLASHPTLPSRPVPSLLLWLLAIHYFTGGTRCSLRCPSPSHPRSPTLICR